MKIYPGQFCCQNSCVIPKVKYYIVGSEGHTSRQELHDEVEVHLVLETVEHFDDPQAICLYQDVPLSTDMTDLRDRQGHTHTQQHTVQKCPTGATATF